MRIDATNNIYGLLSLLSGSNIHSGQYNGSGKTNLVIKKLTEILVVQLCFCSVHYGYRTIQLYIQILGNGLYRR